MDHKLPALLAAAAMLCTAPLPVFAEENDNAAMICLQDDTPEAELHLALPQGTVLAAEAPAYESCENASFRYEKYADHIVLSGFSETGATEKLVVPEKIDGLPVTEIGNYSFYRNETLTSVTIPSGVTTIGEGAFEYCAKLATLSVPDSVYHVGAFSFDGTAWSKAQPDGIVYVGKVALCYKGWEPPEELRLREDTVGVAEWAFGYASGSQYCPEGRIYQSIPLILPKSLRFIDMTFNSGFYGAPRLKIGNIYYAGTEEDFQQVIVTDHLADEETDPQLPRLHFGTTTPEEEPYYILEGIEQLGDVNYDDTVDILDVIVLNKNLMCGTYLPNPDTADVNGDGQIDEADSLAILKSVVRIEPLPVPELPLPDPANTFYRYGMYLPEEMYALLDTVELQPKLEYDVYEGDKANGKRYQHIKLRDADVATLEAFAATHFCDANTTAEKLYVTHQWIHYTNDYAYAGEKWNTIVSKTYVDAIFNYRLGQCIQYNGAMAAMLAYLGFDVWMEGTPGVHWTTYVQIGDTVYNVETGNYGKNGEWQDFFSPVTDEG